MIAATIIYQTPSGASAEKTVYAPTAYEARDRAHRWINGRPDVLNAAVYISKVGGK